MAEIRFLKEEQILLFINKNVTKVTDRWITYSYGKHNIALISLHFFKNNFLKKCRLIMLIEIGSSVKYLSMTINYL